MAGQYAKGTEVSVERTRVEIERTVRKYGATGFLAAWDGDKAAVGFVMGDRQVRFIVPTPDPADREITHTPTNIRRTKVQAKAAYDKAERRIWRLFLVLVKGKLDAVASGVETFDEAFMAHLVLPGGETVAEMIGPRIAAAYETKQVPELLPDYRRAITAGGS